MMDADFTGALLTALWLGILTSISPCPLATNIAAISYVGRKFGSPGSILMSGLLYTAGRASAYSALGILLVAGLLSAFSASRSLQTWLNTALGPLLIITGLVLLDLIKLRSRGSAMGDRIKKRVDRMGYGGAFLLGALFAVSFCPVSAALFFGSLLPVALQHESSVLIPGAYGVATALPVIVFSLLLAAGAASLARAFERVQAFELWGRRATGAVFVLIGAHYSLLYIFKVAIF